MSPVRERSVALAAIWLAVTVWSCTPHPVGPARTFEKYQGKAVTTAESALSVAETVRLIADAASRDRAFGPYTAISLSDQEDSVSGLEGTFSSIQPPDDAAEQLRDDLDQLLVQAVDGVSGVRIAARQGRLSDLADEADTLADVSTGLRAFIDANQQ
jgi:hypothetical protein